MEHIGKALEKAKRGSARRHRSDGHAQPQQPLPPPRPVPGPASPHDDIVYRETRTFPMNPQTLAENRVLAASKTDPHGAVFQMLRTQVLMRLREKGWKSVAVTSPHAGAGKTLVATNLAVSISQEVNQTVLLVDMDLRRPGVARTFGIQPEYGLQDYLFDDVPLPQIFVNPGMERLVLLPGRGTVVHSSEMLSTPKSVRLIEDIKQRYDSRVVVFDLPPLLTSDDALVCIAHADAVLLVVEDGKTTEEDVTRSLGLLENANLLGTVLNKSDVGLRTYY